MSMKARLKLRAAAYKNIIERKDLLIKEQPRIRRIAIAHWKTTRSAQVTNVERVQHIYGPERLYISAWIDARRSSYPKAFVVRIERRWAVYTDREKEMWDNLIMAQAHRDGLNLHYSRYLMAKGTNAAEYA